VRSRPPGDRVRRRRDRSGRGGPEGRRTIAAERPRGRAAARIAPRPLGLGSPRSGGEPPGLSRRRGPRFPDTRVIHSRPLGGNRVPTAL
jgi:hypothetical protein